MGPDFFITSATTYSNNFSIETMGTEILLSPIQQTIVQICRKSKQQQFN